MKKGAGSHTDNVALIAADELNGLLETAHLLRSDRNAQRLQTALLRVQKGEGKARKWERERDEGVRREIWIHSSRNVPYLLQQFIV